uniref:Uncharacterized protein n=1 Tax=Amphimedon queenslandica TaxID=400682 RepID=A0A1X7SL80_AMPQE
MAEVFKMMIKWEIYYNFLIITGSAKGNMLGLASMISLFSEHTSLPPGGFLRLHLYLRPGAVVELKSGLFVAQWTNAQPTLDDVTLDLDAGELSLTFSDLDAGLDINCSLIKIGLPPGNIDSAIALSGTGSHTDNVVTCDLTDSVQIYLRATNVTIGDVTSSRVYFEDGNGIRNGTGEFNSSAGVLVNMIMNDTTPPSFSSFVEFDMDYGLLTFSFSE